MRLCPPFGATVPFASRAAIAFKKALNEYAELCISYSPSMSRYAQIQMASGDDETVQV
jgi:hypothetical protein